MEANVIVVNSAFNSAKFFIPDLPSCVLICVVVLFSATEFLMRNLGFVV